MSRVGKQPVVIPKGVEIKVQDGSLSCKGPKGTLTVPINPGITAKVADGAVVLERQDDEKQTRANHGTFRALVANMIDGVTKGYSRKLEVVGVGYRATLTGKKLSLMVGFANPREVIAPEGITFTVADQTKIEVSGIDKQKVGQLAAQIRSMRKPEPYKGKGVRYVGEHVRRKAGKAAK